MIAFGGCTPYIQKSLSLKLPIQFPVNNVSDVIIVHEHIIREDHDLIKMLKNNIINTTGMKPKTITLSLNIIEAVSILLKKVFNKEASYILMLIGTNNYIHIFTLISLMLSGKTALVYLYYIAGKDKACEVMIPKEVLAVLQHPLTSLERSILEFAVKNPGIRYEDLTMVLGRRVKGIKNLTLRLKEKGLIYRKGRRRGYILLNGVRVHLFMCFYIGDHRFILVPPLSVWFHPSLRGRSPPNPSDGTFM